MIVIAQIAAAFAGFGSLASGLGQRIAGDDAKVDASRLALMLFTSLSATIFGLLPHVLVGVVGSEAASLRLSAVAAVLAILLYTPSAMRRTIANRSVPGFNMPVAIANGLFSILSLASFASCAAAMQPDRLPQLYLCGLMGMLGSTIVMFARVIVSMLRPHNENESA